MMLFDWRHAAVGPNQPRLTTPHTSPLAGMPLRGFLAIVEGAIGMSSIAVPATDVPERRGDVKDEHVVIPLGVCKASARGFVHGSLSWPPTIRSVGDLVHLWVVLHDRRRLFRFICLCARMSFRHVTDSEWISSANALYWREVPGSRSSARQRLFKRSRRAEISSCRVMEAASEAGGFKGRSQTCRQ